MQRDFEDFCRRFLTRDEVFEIYPWQLEYAERLFRDHQVSRDEGPGMTLDELLGEIDEVLEP